MPLTRDTAAASAPPTRRMAGRATRHARDEGHGRGLPRPDQGMAGAAARHAPDEGRGLGLRRPDQEMARAVPAMPLT